MTTRRLRKTIRYGRKPRTNWREREAQRRPIREGIERLLSKPRPPALNLPFMKPPPTVSASRDYLKQLSLHIANFFGVERQDAAHFLFLIWMNCFGRNFGHDPAKGLKQFQRDVNKETKTKKTRGRPPSGIVAFALQRFEDEDNPSDLQVCKEWYEKEGRLEQWKNMGAKERKARANRLTDNCRKKIKPQKRRDPEKL